MLTYFIIAIGIFLFVGFAILDQLKEVRRAQRQQFALLQELSALGGQPTKWRPIFLAGRIAPSVLLPGMFTPYLEIMTEDQNHRYRQWISGSDKVSLTFEEGQALERKLQGMTEQNGPLE